MLLQNRGIRANGYNTVGICIYMSDLEGVKLIACLKQYNFSVMA